MKRQRVWDLPTRITHWLLAAAVAFAFVSGQIGGELIDWHGRAGLAIVGLVVFRIVWGFVGATTARFASFVRGPQAIRSYLRGEWRGIGHNPLGALSVLALLAFVAAQVLTGLFSNDDIAYQGPLAGLISKELSDHFHAWHELLQKGLIVLVGVHLAAIAFYMRVKRENLVKPMITGWKQHESAGTAHPLRHGSLVGLILAVAIASGAVYAASGALLPTAVAAPIAAPAW
jgi:cytochrome b